MDKARFRKRVLMDLLCAPLTMVPAALGASLLLVAWAMERGSGVLAILGVVGLLTGVGTLVTRWIFRSDEIARRAFEDIQEELLDDQRKKLDKLDRRLQQDDDPNNEQFLRQLRKLYNGFRGDAQWSEKLSARIALEIATQVEKLFKACIISLERSLELWEMSEKMATQKGRAGVLATRNQLLDEIQVSVQQLAQTIDDVQALSIKKRDEQDLAHIREELSASLDVARKVEQRMDSLEAELGRSIDARRE